MNCVYSRTDNLHSADTARRSVRAGLGDLDLDEGIAYISRQLQQGANGQLKACPLKTESSRRAVSAPIAAGQNATSAGLPPVRLHDLRHGAATLMLLTGEELKTIANQLGHSSVVLTADTCLSVAVELGLKAAAAAAWS